MPELTIDNLGCNLLWQVTHLHLLYPVQAAGPAFVAVRTDGHAPVHGHSHGRHCQVLEKSRRPQLWEACRKWLCEGLVNPAPLKQTSQEIQHCFSFKSSSPTSTRLYWKQFGWFSIKQQLKNNFQLYLLAIPIPNEGARHLPKHCPGARPPMLYVCREAGMLPSKRGILKHKFARCAPFECCSYG